MTEEEWLGCAPADLDTMLTFLRGRRASTRKVWLFACACCRGVWPLLTDPRSRAAVEAAERYADGLVTVETLEAAGKGALGAIAEGGGIRALSVMAHRVTLSESAGNLWAAASSAYSALLDPSWRVERFRFTKRMTDGQRRGIFDVSARLRDSFGPLPFRPVSVEPAVLGRDDRTVPKLAQAIYDGLDFDRLPILGDALEDAGCDNEEVLSHCRGPETHSRGCWCLDLILGNG
jgi:hypothetical protein